MPPDAVRSLVWIGDGTDAATFLWHALAPDARALRLRAMGPGRCSLDWRFPAGSGIRPALPPAALLPDSAAALDRALDTVLGGAGPLRVLALGAGADPVLVAAVRARMACDIVCSPDGEAVCAESPAAAWLAAARLDFAAAWQARRMAGGALVNVTDLLAPQGLRPVEAERATALAWTGPQLRTVLLLPDCGGPRARFSLHLAASRLPLDADHYGVWIDGTERVAHFSAQSIVVEAEGLAEQPFRRLDLRHAELRRGPDGETPAGCALHAVRVERLA